jgi:hypothetical protein
MWQGNNTDNKPNPLIKGSELPMFRITLWRIKMKLDGLNKALATGAIAVALTASQQVFAAPMFSFTHQAGFANSLVGVQNQTYDGPVLSVGGEFPDATPLYSALSWGFAATAAGKSSLELATQSGEFNDLTATSSDWTTIATLFQHNNAITQVLSWTGQELANRLQITDSEGGDAMVLDSQTSIMVDFRETSNVVVPCPSANIFGSKCDDFLSFAPDGFSSIDFMANDGNLWTAHFRLANLVNAATADGLTIYTGEAFISSFDIQVLVSRIPPPPEVPEPATLGLFCAALAGLGLINHRKQKA